MKKLKIYIDTSIVGGFFDEEFKEHTGFSPKEYFTSKKIETAQDYIRGTDLPLKTIADELGYTDVLAFYRQFKRVAGIPPAEYRKKMKK